MSVRTRIAPSPTGDPHVGTAYIALFNWVFAKKMGGQFILRIEDTDQARSTSESEQRILEALAWSGIKWDEGPDVGGCYGPYRQSERSDIYQEKIDELLKKGHAFRCFCSEARLNDLRQQQVAAKKKPGYDGRCLNLDPEEVAKKLAAGDSSVVRMMVPSEGSIKIEDMLRGPIEIDWSQVDMQVLLKADGLPTYHLANVVDDHLMKISHVIRGEEWINSTPKHLLLYQYFGWSAPKFCHMPLLRNPDKSKLSKRKNPTSILYYQRLGYMPEALLNYLGRMGWSMPDEREKFSMDEMIESFDISRVSLGGPVFDREKLKWLNGQWIRDTFTPSSLVSAVQEWAFNPNYILPMLEDGIKRIETFSDLTPLLAFYFSGQLALSDADFVHKKLSPEEVKALLQLVLWSLEELHQWDKESIHNVFKCFAGQREMKLKDLMLPFFVAITGRASSVPVMDAMVILGPDMSRVRIREAIDVLGGISKKALKKLEKERISVVRV